MIYSSTRSNNEPRSASYVIMNGIAPDGGLYIPERIPAPITKGTALGTVTYTYNGKVIGSANLVALNDVERNELMHIIHIIGKIIFSPYFFIPLIIILLLISNHNRKKKLKLKKLKRQQRLAMEEKEKAEFLSSISKNR